MWELEGSSGARDAAGRRWPRPDLRAGDADRQRVVAELQRHYVDGRLSEDELAERLARASHARTFGELSAVLADLPPLDGATGSPTSGPPMAHPAGWPGSIFGVPVGAVLLVLGLLAMVWMFVGPGLHMGGLPIWPLFIWGFFFIGRPGRRFH